MRYWKTSTPKMTASLSASLTKLIDIDSESLIVGVDQRNCTYGGSLFVW